MSFSLNQLYKNIGITKQAVHQFELRQRVFDKKVGLLISEVDKLRGEHPGCGVEKMYYTLKPKFIGRDRFIELFMDLGYRIKRSKNYRKTTYPSVFAKYPNLIEGLLLYEPSQVWQSDITYIRIGEVFYYAVFIIDVYTKKIVGYCVSDSLRAQANVKALKMAVAENDWPVFHHSDRGSQYVYKIYTDLLENNGTSISMCNMAIENAYAERINNTIKNEYLAYWNPKDFKQLQRQMKKAVFNYNHTRIHNHLQRKTPVEFEKEVLNLPVHSRPMARIYADGQIKMDRALSPLPFYAQQNLKAQICPII